MTNACCVTGHRGIPTDKMTYVQTRLKEEIEEAIADGFTTFITGMAEGVDLLFAELVIEQKKHHPALQLIAAIPHRGRLATRNLQFIRCLDGCDSIHVGQEQYSSSCFFSRNRYMVSESSRVIAVYDGREGGGTRYTIRYAASMEREVREIRI